MSGSGPRIAGTSLTMARPATEPLGSQAQTRDVWYAAMAGTLTPKKTCVRRTAASPDLVNGTSRSVSVSVGRSACDEFIAARQRDEHLAVVSLLVTASSSGAS